MHIKPMPSKSHFIQVSKVGNSATGILEVVEKKNDDSDFLFSLNTVSPVLFVYILHFSGYTFRLTLHLLKHSKFSPSFCKFLLMPPPFQDHTVSISTTGNRAVCKVCVCVCNKYVVE